MCERIIIMEIVLNRRQLEIIRQLENTKQYISAAALANSFDVSIRTIRTDIREISLFLEDYDCEFEKIPHVGMRILTKKPITENITNSFDLSNFIVFDREIRQDLMILTILAHDREYITLGYLSDLFLISKNTTVREVEEAGNILRQHGLKLRGVKSKGYRISGLEEVHCAMESTMHPDARSASPDYNALIYSLLRIPSCIMKVKKLVLGQNAGMFYSQGYRDIESWPIVTAPARRRICRYDGKETLAVFINSKSDIEDIVPLVTAFQIEWNKMHELLQPVDESRIFSAAIENDTDAFSALAESLLSSAEDLERLRLVWKEKMAADQKKGIAN